MWLDHEGKGQEMRRGKEEKNSSDTGLEGWVRFLQVKMGNGDKTERGRWKVGEKFRPGKVVQIGGRRGKPVLTLTGEGERADG